VSGRVIEHGTVALAASANRLAAVTPTRDWERLLRFDDNGLRLLDLAGRELATLVDRWQERRNRTAGPLSGDRFGCIEEEPSGLRLRVFDRDGRPLSDALLEGRFPIQVGGEPQAGLLALGVAPASVANPRATLFVDLATGSVLRVEPRLSPALRRWGYGASSANHAPGSLATRLFTAAEGLLRVDPLTGSRAVLLARRGSDLED
jgi:hypothetical protein